MEVNRVAAEDAFFAKMGEAGVADPAATETMINGVTSRAVRIGAFDDDVASQVGCFAAELAAAGVFELERFVERQRDAIDGRNTSCLGLTRLRHARFGPV